MKKTEIELMSDSEKILLLEQIWDSLGKESVKLSQAHKEELDRRIEMHQRGETRYSTWEEVKNRI